MEAVKEGSLADPREPAPLCEEFWGVEIELKFMPGGGRPIRSAFLAQHAPFGARFRCFCLLLAGYADFARYGPEWEPFISRRNAWKLLRKKRP